MQTDINNREIQIDIQFDDYRITADEYQYTLESGRGVREKDAKQYSKGDVYYKRRRYYSKLEHVLHALMEDRIRKSDASTLEELLEAMNEAREWAQEVSQGI